MKAILSIDLQKQYFEPGSPLEIPDGKAVLAQVTRLLAKAREKGQLIIHIRHISKNPEDSKFRAGSPQVEFMEEVKPLKGEPVITKTRPGAFYLTELDDILKRKSIDEVVICGLMSFMCCDTTAREAHARGYQVYFLKDATAALKIGDIPAETVHQVTCAIQGFLFSKVLTAGELVL